MRIKTAIPIHSIRIRDSKWSKSRHCVHRNSFAATTIAPCQRYQVSAKFIQFISLASCRHQSLSHIAKTGHSPNAHQSVGSPLIAFRLEWHIWKCNKYSSSEIAIADWADLHCPQLTSRKYLTSLKCNAFDECENGHSHDCFAPQHTQTNCIQMCTSACISQSVVSRHAAKEI